jgi:chromosome segregation ATPase
MAEHYRSEQHQIAIILFIDRDLSKLTSDPYERGSRMDFETFPQASTSIPDNTNTPLEDVCETMDILAGGIQTLNEDSQRLNNESVYLKSAMDNLNEEFTAVKLSIQEQNTFLDGLGPNQEILQQDLLSLKQKIEDLQFISCDGTLTWKISNVAEKMGQIFTDKIYS